jgi:hypothetical protein
MRPRHRPVPNDSLAMHTDPRVTSGIFVEPHAPTIASNAWNSSKHAETLKFAQGNYDTRDSFNGHFVCQGLHCHVIRVELQDRDCSA